MKRVTRAIPALFILAGCKSAPAIHPLQASVARLPGGWSLGESRDGTNSIGVAPGWRVGVDRLSTNSGMGDLGTSPSSGDPAAAAQLQQITQELDKMDKAGEEKALAALEKKGVILQVISTGKPIFDETRTRYYVIRRHLDGNATWADAAEHERRHYAFPPKPEEVQLPIGKAYRLSADDTLRNGSVRHEISYVTIDGQDIYSLRLVTEEDASVIKQIAEDAAKTWRIRPRVASQK